MYCATLAVEDLRREGLPAEALSTGGNPNKQRTSKPSGVVCHTPGGAFAAKALQRAEDLNRNGAPTPIEIDRMAATLFDVAVYQPGYLIGTSGTVFQLDVDFKRTQHSGMLATECPGGNVYAKGTWREWSKPLGGSWQQHGRPGHVVYDWWDAAFPGLAGPLEAFPWGRYPNDAIGIDLLPDPTHGGAFNEAQVEAFVALVRLLSEAHGFRISKSTVTTHSLASPCERGGLIRGGKVIGVHWDPPAGWNFPRVLAQLGAR